MDNRKVNVEIICPNCAKKALFHSVLIGTYKLYPDKNGRVTCISCGYNSSHVFSNRDYFYKVVVGRRILYAQTLENLILLRNYFLSGQYKGYRSPDDDYPKVFYKGKEEIIRKIDRILEDEIKH